MVSRSADRSRSAAGRRPFALRTLLACVAMSAALVAGCGEEEEVDPYVYGTLDQVTRGHVQSEGYLFEIDAPEFVLLDGNTGIARVGNHLEVIVGDDLENRAANWEGKMLGVQKFFSPYVWLMVKRVKEPVGETFNITELDSVPDPVLPEFTDVDLEEVSGFDLGSLRYNQREAIEDMVDAEVQGVGVVTQLPDHEWEEPEDAADDTTAAEPPMAWYLQAEGSDATFKITNVTEELELAFELLQAENLPFIGGVKIMDPYPWVERRESRVSAPIEVTFVRYANRYLAP